MATNTKKTVKKAAAPRSKPKSKSTPKAQQKLTPESLPLFFHDPHPLSLDRHRHAGLNPLASLAFAAHTNSVPLNAVEFFEAARSYPIVFTRGIAPMPVALLGIQEINYFLNAEGEWDAQTYIPAYVRRYPFIFMQDDAQQRFILCVDEAASHFTASNPASRFYDDKEQPAPLINEALQFCSIYQQQYEQTVVFSKAMKEAGVLVEKKSSLQLSDGRQIGLEGFLVLDVEALRALPDALFLEWRSKDWLPLIDALLLSAVNWKYLAGRAARSL